MGSKKESGRAPGNHDHYRRPFRQVRIKKVLADVVEQVRTNSVEEFTEWVNRAVKMRLEAEGHWPPPPPKK